MTVRLLVVDESKESMKAKRLLWSTQLFFVEVRASTPLGKRLLSLTWSKAPPVLFTEYGVLEGYERIKEYIIELKTGEVIEVAKRAIESSQGIRVTIDTSLILRKLGWSRNATTSQIVYNILKKMLIDAEIEKRSNKVKFIIKKGDTHVL